MYWALGYLVGTLVTYVVALYVTAAARPGDDDVIQVVLTAALWPASVAFGFLILPIVGTEWLLKRLREKR